MTKSPYPFSALVGQAEMQLGLLIAAVDPMVGGVLILGHRGTGKSTAVRALADVLPPLNKRAVPVVDLPLGATEDRILGSINLERLRARRSLSRGYSPRLTRAFSMSMRSTSWRTISLTC
jgi:magnesium chelatase subunit I